MNLNTRNISQQSTLCGRMFKRVVLTAAIIGLSGCATVSDWFADEDEIKIRIGFGLEVSQGYLF